MTPWKLFLSSWEFSPPVVIGCALLLGFYLKAVNFKLNGKTVNFTLGVLIIFLALVSPVDTIGEEYLFSAHMLQHMMLGFISTVLLVAGTPASFVRAWLKFPIIAQLERLCSRPQFALLLANATIWIWHLPGIYNLTLQNDALHNFEHITFIVTGVILWWPVFKPIPEGRLSPLAAMIYVQIAAALCTILGIIFTLSDTPYYSCYANPEDELGALKMIREDWGLSQIADQKLGGALMWEPAGAIFLWAILNIMSHWYREDSNPDLKTNSKDKSQEKVDRIEGVDDVKSD